MLCCIEQFKSRQNSQDAGGSCLKVDETEGEETAEAACVEDLSCAAMTWEDTLSRTMDRADLLKGQNFKQKHAGIYCYYNWAHF